MTRLTDSPNEVETLKRKNLRATYRTCYKSASFLKFLTAPDCYFIENSWEQLKGDQYSSTTVCVNRKLIKNRPVVAKRYNKKNAWHALRRTVRRSRAENCWNHAIDLEALGINIPSPVAFIQEYASFGLKSCSWYLYEFVDGPSCVKELKNNGITNDDEVMEKVVATLGSLWKQNISHGDTKGTNFLLAHDRVVIIDLDSIKQHTNEGTARRFIRKDLLRFLRNWEDNPHLLEIAQTKLKLLGFNL